MKTSNQHGMRAGTAGLAAAAVAFTLAAGARAGDIQDSSVQIRIRYSALDAHRSAGAAALYRRIRAAAAEVCEASLARELGQAALVKTCINRAVSTAVAQVNSPTLTGQYLMREFRSRSDVQLAARR